MAVESVGSRSRRSFLRRRVSAPTTLGRAVPKLCTAAAACTALRAAARLTSGGLTQVVSGGARFGVPPSCVVGEAQKKKVVSGCPTLQHPHLYVSEREEQRRNRREEEWLGREENKAEDWEYGDRGFVEKLAPVQQKAVASVLEGQNTFITGGAGTGKTFIVLSILEALEKLYDADFNVSVCVSASTGSAAVAIRGATLHHVSGVGVPKFHSDFKATETQPYARIWQQMKVLIIDEISMISGEFFDLLEASVRKVRGSEKPFGGLQVVLVGDMYQLEPIKHRVAEQTKKLLDPSKFHQRRAIVKRAKTTAELFLNRGLVFQSDAFWDLNLNFVTLTQSYRQQSQPEFYKALKTLRCGKSRQQQRLSAVQYINKHCHKGYLNVPVDDNTMYLYPRLDEVARANDARLRYVPGGATIFEAMDINPSVGVNASIPCAFKHVPKRLELKVGARVTLITNLRHISERLVNGLQGTVVRIDRETPPCMVTVDFDDEGEIQISQMKFISDVPGVGRHERQQLPLQLGWAMTHHKAQGKTLEKAVVNPSSFARGQAYVALSRTRNMEDMILTRPLRDSDVVPSRMSAAFEKRCRKPDTARKFLGHWRDAEVPGLWSVGRDNKTKISPDFKLLLEAVAKNKPKSALFKKTKKKKKYISRAKKLITRKIAIQKRGKGKGGG